MVQGAGASICRRRTWMRRCRCWAPACSPPTSSPGSARSIRPHYFYRLSHQRIYEAIEDLFSRGEPVDPITVSEELSNRASLEVVGGRAFVHSLVSAVPAATNARLLRGDRARELPPALAHRGGGRDHRYGLPARAAPVISSTGPSRWSSTSRRPGSSGEFEPSVS